MSRPAKTRRLKVFATAVMGPGHKQMRAVVATTSRKAAAELLGLSNYEASQWMTESGNEKEVDAALVVPGQVVWRLLDSHNDPYVLRTTRKP